ncbi:MAG: translation initiation factor IF-3 [Proteobacteria bacterium]|nr:translation initiation factor IF-3 [Pseudomonadota bacterium]
MRLNNGTANKEGPRVNQEITSHKVRLVNELGEMIGIVTRQEALKAALDAGLDLVEISPNADPPVCKILDYGKYKYEQQKKKHQAKKKQKVIEVKEIQLRPMINDNDLQVKCRAIQRFLSEGNKVKISMRFRGRELSHQDLGMEVLMRIKNDFEELAKIETFPKLEGKQMVMIMAPK